MLADPYPYARVDAVGCGHALQSGSYMLDSTSYVLQVLQADAQVVADVRGGDPLAVEGFQDEAGVLPTVVPHQDAIEGGEALALACLLHQPAVVCDVLVSLALVVDVRGLAHDEHPPQDDCSADGKLLRELLERAVRPLAWAARGGDGGVCQEGLPRNEDSPGDAVAVHLDTLVR